MKKLTSDQLRKIELYVHMNEGTSLYGLARVCRVSPSVIYKARHLMRWSPTSWGACINGSTSIESAYRQIRTF